MGTYGTLCHLGRSLMKENKGFLPDLRLASMIQNKESKVKDLEKALFCDD